MNTPEQSLKDKLYIKKKELEQKKAEDEKNKQSESLSLEKKFEENKKLNQEKQEQEIREQIIIKKQEIEDAEKKIEEIKAPRTSEVHGEELRKQEMELQKIEMDLANGEKELEVLFLENKEWLEKSGVKDAKDLLNDVNYAETPDVKAMRDLTHAKIEKALERDDLQSKKELAEKEEASLPSREEQFKTIGEQITHLKQQIAELEEQLPEAREKKAEEIAYKFFVGLFAGEKDKSLLLKKYALHPRMLADRLGNIYSNGLSSSDRYGIWDIKEQYGDEFLDVVFKKISEKFIDNTFGGNDKKRSSIPEQTMLATKGNIYAIFSRASQIAEKSSTLHQEVYDFYEHTKWISRPDSTRNSYLRTNTEEYQIQDLAEQLERKDKERNTYENKIYEEMKKINGFRTNPDIVLYASKNGSISPELSEEILNKEREGELQWKKSVEDAFTARRAFEGAGFFAKLTGKKKKLRSEMEELEKAKMDKQQVVERNTKNKEKVFSTLNMVRDGLTYFNTYVENNELFHQESGLEINTVLDVVRNKMAIDAEPRYMQKLENQKKIEKMMKEAREIDSLNKEVPGVDLHAFDTLSSIYNK